MGNDRLSAAPTVIYSYLAVIRQRMNELDGTTGLGPKALITAKSLIQMTAMAAEILLSQLLWIHEPWLHRLHNFGSVPASCRSQSEADLLATKVTVRPADK